MADDDTRYRSRKWRLACWVEGCATIAAAWVVFTSIDPMPVLWWWMSVSGTVLGGYGILNVAATNASKP